jgi:aryl-alcohol dehydrogenase-like predicted oxidoreductase
MGFDERVTLGRTGLSVGRLGIADGYKVPAAAVEKAFHEHGLNYFYWGSRKKPMGEALANLVKTSRDDMVIATQSYDHLGWFIPGTVERGLKELGTDHVDVLILGWYNSMPANRIMDAAMKLKHEGKVRFLAVSGHNRSFFGKVVQREDNPFDILQVRYNAAHRGAETEVFAHLPDEGRPGVTTYTATRWGRLLKPGRMPPGEKPLSSADCYAFVLSNPAVDVCMTGPRSVKEMDEALLVLKRGPLDDEQMARIRRIGDHVHG